MRSKPYETKRNSPSSELNLEFGGPESHGPNFDQSESKSFGIKFIEPSEALCASQINNNRI